MLWKPMCIPVKDILLRILLRVLNHSHVLAFGIICFYFSFLLIYVNGPQSHPLLSEETENGRHLLTRTIAPVTTENAILGWKYVSVWKRLKSFKVWFDKFAVINQRIPNSRSIIDSSAEFITETRDSPVYFDI